MTAVKESITLTPTFTLFRVDPEKVATKYAAGVYANLHITNPGDTSGGIKAVFVPTYTGDKHDGVFSFRDKSGGEVVIATSNAANYTSERGTSQHVKGGRCHYCRQEFSHESIGVVLGKTHYRDVSDEVTLMFFIEGVFDDFRCALAYIIESPESYRRLYPNILTDTKSLYALMHPKGPPLMPANDWRLLKSNGGSLDRETWLEGQYHYIEMPGIILDQARVPFMRTISKA